MKQLMHSHIQDRLGLQALPDRHQRVGRRRQVALAPAATANRDPATDPTPGDPNWESGSALGKARDAAVRTKAQSDAYQKEVSKQADEVFKNR